MERCGAVLNGSNIGLGEEVEHEALAEPCAQLEMDCGLLVERRGPTQAGHIIGLRDGLSKPKKKCKVS